MTPQHSKHPDWDEIWEQVGNAATRDASWFENYIKSHDINQCMDEHGNTLLHHAVHDDDQGAILWLSELLIDPNIKNNAGQTALQIAQDAEADCLECLQEYHLCVDFAKASYAPNGLDALLAAIYRGDATLGDTSGVLDEGNEVNAGDWTALHFAARYDRPQQILALHQRFPNLDVDYLNYTGYLALRLATMHGHSNCIIALRCCFPMMETGDALQAACQYNRLTCIFTMRKCFPNLTGNELRYDEYSSALAEAARSNNPDCFRALHSCFPDIDPDLQDDIGTTALIAAVSAANHSCLSVLYECFPDIDPNKQDISGDTALMWAIKRGLPHSVTFLSTHFPTIDVNQRNKQGKTALLLAIEEGDEKCLIALCESFPNLDPTIRDNDGYTALMLAVRNENLEPISQLVKFFPNIDPNIQFNQGGFTALMMSAFRYKYDYQSTMIPQLCKLFPNIDPNVQSNQTTALMMLSETPTCSVEFMRQFLDAFPNADANIQNYDGETALSLAIKDGNVSIVPLLLERFPDIYFPIDRCISANSTEQTALMLAIEHDRLDVIDVLLKHIIQLD